MQRRIPGNFIRLVVIGAIAFTTAPVARSQTTKTPVKEPVSNRSAAFRTPWGDPDLQGIYSSDDFKGVPFERPIALGQKEFLTDEEYAKRTQDLEKQIQEDQASAITNRKPRIWGRATCSTGTTAANRSARHLWSSIHSMGGFRTGMENALLKDRAGAAASAEPRSTALRTSRCSNDV